jgi:hypothetical protein
MNAQIMICAKRRDGRWRCSLADRGGALSHHSLIRPPPKYMQQRYAEALPSRDL